MTLAIGGILPPPAVQLVDENGNLSSSWRDYLRTISLRTGGTVGVNAGTPVKPAIALPLVDGIAAVGGSVLYGRQDHVHPNAGKKASVKLAWHGNNVVAVGPFPIVEWAPFGFKIDSMDYTVGTSAGSFTAFVTKTNSSGVISTIGGLSGVNVSLVAKTNRATSGANTVISGDSVYVLITSVTGRPTEAILSLNVTRT